MKNTFKRLGIAAVIAVIGFVMAGCNNGGGPTVPGEVENFTAIAGYDQVVLQWAAPSDDGGSAIIYEVTKDDWPNKVTIAASELTYTYIGLTKGTEYTFKVRAVNEQGAGAATTQKATTTIWYLSENEGGQPAAGSSKTGPATGEWYVYIYFDPVPAGINSIKLSFTTTGDITLIRQAAYDDTGTWGWSQGDVISGAAWDFSGTPEAWGATGTALNMKTLKGLCIMVEGAGTFTLTDVVIN